MQSLLKTRLKQETVRILTGATLSRRHTDAALRRTPYIGVLLLLAMSCSHAGATDQPLAAVERAAETFLANFGSGGKAKAAALDRRLRLARCDVPLEAFMRPGSKIRQRTIVGVRCSGAQPWKVYVPVNLIDERDVVVLRRALPRGHELTADDLQVEQRDVSRLTGGYATDLTAVVGQRLKQSLQGGSIVTTAATVSKVLVRRGQSVTLRAQNDAIHIRVAGKALMDGALGQRIRVKNAASGRIVEGLVRSAELVEVLVQ
ncbi:MAG: flagellar basal body P-ring formation chaperone FlgA [Woeseia sp.]